MFYELKDTHRHKRVPRRLARVGEPTLYRATLQRLEALFSSAPAIDVQQPVKAGPAETTAYEHSMELDELLPDIDSDDLGGLAKRYAMLRREMDDHEAREEDDAPDIKRIASGFRALARL